MKWRHGIFEICPYCFASRDGAGHKRLGPRLARVHHYTCGCSIEEWHTQKRQFLQCHVTSSCAGGNLVLSRSLSAIVNQKNLTTIELIKDHMKLAERACSYLSYKIHHAVSNYMRVNDNWRLPPIPQIRSLTRPIYK